MEITFGSWQLREWQPGDEQALVKYANNRKIWLNLRDTFPHPYTAEDAKWWISHAADKRGTNFAVINGNEAIGGIGLELRDDVYRRSAEVGYWLGEPFWGKGIATHALGALVKHAFSSFDLARLYANVFEWNPASSRVLEKNGFLLEGIQRKSITKDGRTIDSFLYSLLRTP
jgi:[ribosomal protein S5]-alanine N-acetyltransferase